jgi:hypothetical protein
MVEVGEPQRIAVEEHRRVVADDIPIAFLSIELQREAPNVALGIGGAAFAGDGRVAGEHRRLRADCRKDFCLGVARNVMRDSKYAVRAGTFRVHAPLRNHLAGEMREFFEQPDILQQRRAARPGGQDVEIV